MEEEQDQKLELSKPTYTKLELVEKTFQENGFNNENPDDIKIVADILEVWTSNNFNEEQYSYTPEQYVLLNDPDVLNVLNQCRAYFEPKKHLTKGDLRGILENIALGTLNRKDYNFKTGEVVTIDPTFSERIQAIKMLQEDADLDNKKSSIQFVNNIINVPNPLNPDGLPIARPNMEAPKAPPEGHYSLNLNEHQEENTDSIGEEE